MVDRSKVETILSRRFPGASDHQIAAAANALMGLADEWEEVANSFEVRGHRVCHDGCWLASGTDEGTELRLFRRRAL